MLREDERIPSVGGAVVEMVSEGDVISASMGVAPVIGVTIGALS